MQGSTTLLHRVLMIDVFAKGSKGLRFQGCDMDFDVSYSSDGEPAKANINIHGISRDHLNDYLSLNKLVAKVTAGYKGPGYGQVFSGSSELGGITHTRTAGTYILHVGLAAGVQLNSTTVQLAEGGATRVFDIATRLADQLGVPITEYAPDKSITLVNGYSANTNGYDALRKLAMYLGCGVSFEDDGIKFFNFDGKTSGNSVLVSSANNSLLEFSIDTDSDHKTRYKASFVLNHTVRPGSYVTVHRDNRLMRTIDKYSIVAEDVKHTGAFRGGLMKTTIVGRLA